jgi:hypothetical protein
VKGAYIGVLTGLQGLGWDEAREKPVDRLTAISAIQNATANRALNTAHLCSLGKDLVAFKFAHRPASRDAAVTGLALALRDKKGLKLSDVARWRVASHAIHEWAVDLCPTCLGAREIPDHDAPRDGPQPMKECGTCHSTGRRRYTDDERIQAMGELFEQAMYEAHSLISTAEALSIEQATWTLGRRA